MNIGKCLAGVLLAWSFAALPPAAAEVKLPAILSDNMVLQQGARAPVWGTADPGEEVTVTIAGQRWQATADPAGRWSLKLDPMKAGGPLEMVVAGRNTIRVQNVMVGEVWLCSGQSNMQFTMGNAQNPQQEAAQATYPEIRTFNVELAISTEPKSDCQGSWIVCSPQVVRREFSAVAYYFGRELHRTLGAPIGLINSSWGGTAIQLWMDRRTLESDPELRPIVARADKSLTDFAGEFLARNAGPIREWAMTAEKAKAEGKSVPLPPVLPLDPRILTWDGGPSLATSIYNAMVAPLTPYAIKGVIWYQGEANAWEAYRYRKLLPMMIQGWRRAWGQRDLPFLFVQLANFTPSLPDPRESNWAELREAQLMTLSLPRTGMAVTIDIGEADDIHPRNKQEVGRRLGLAAEAIAYGRDLVYSGPIYQSMAIEGDKIRLRFTQTGGGLITAGRGAPEGFAIAGDDRRFVWAYAEIAGDTVLVSSPKVPKPVAVRYAWADNPVCNLYNREGLPASPFRTDSWPGITEGR